MITIKIMLTTEGEMTIIFREGDRNRYYEAKREEWANKKKPKQFRTYGFIWDRYTIRKLDRRAIELFDIFAHTNLEGTMKYKGKAKV